MQYFMLTKENCPWCDLAKGLIKESGGAVVALSITEYPPLKTLLVKAGYKTVPQIWNEQGEYIGGYEDLYQRLAKDDQS